MNRTLMTFPATFDSLFEELRRWPETRSWVQMQRGTDGVTVVAELPGFAVQDVTVEHNDGELVITAVRGERSRKCRVRVGSGTVSASMEHGELRVTVKPSAETRRIEIAERHVQDLQEDETEQK